MAGYWLLIISRGFQKIDKRQFSISLKRFFQHGFHHKKDAGLQEQRLFSKRDFRKEILG
jgi:hypothetical protein